jgi:hypothetical protein
MYHLIFTSPIYFWVQKFRLLECQHCMVLSVGGNSMCVWACAPYYGLNDHVFYLLFMIPSLMRVFFLLKEKKLNKKTRFIHVTDPCSTHGNRTNPWPKPYPKVQHNFWCIERILWYPLYIHSRCSCIVTVYTLSVCK